MNIDFISKNFEEKTSVDGANRLLASLKDKNFVIIRHFLHDILYKLKLISLEMQKSMGTVIGKSDLLMHFRKFLDNINEDGPILTSYLEQVNCIPYSYAIKCPINIHEYAPSVIWQGIEIRSLGEYQNYLN